MYCHVERTQGERYHIIIILALLWCLHYPRSDSLLVLCLNFSMPDSLAIREGHDTNSLITEETLQC